MIEISPGAFYSVVMQLENRALHSVFEVSLERIPTLSCTYEVYYKKRPGTGMKLIGSRLFLCCLSARRLNFMAVSGCPVKETCMERQNRI